MIRQENKGNNSSRSQTLDRGLTALVLVAEADQAPTIDELGVHRSVAIDLSAPSKTTT